MPEIEIRFQIYRLKWAELSVKVLIMQIQNKHH